MLSELQIRNAKPKDRKYKLYVRDGSGLYLCVTPSGGKLWQMQVIIPTTKSKTVLSLGKYPVISYKDARTEAAKKLELLAKGIDPREEKKRLQKEAEEAKQRKALTFKVVAEKWLAEYKQGRAKKTVENAEGRLKNHAFPTLGAMPFKEIKRSDYAAIVSSLPSETEKSTAFKMASILKQIDDFGIDRFDLQGNRAEGLTRRLRTNPEKVQHHPAITNEVELKEVLGILDSFFKAGGAAPATRYALKILPYVAVRIGTLLKAEWSEFDFEKRIWQIPISNEKDRKEMTIPLSRQVAELLTDLKKGTQQLYGETTFCFPSYGKTKHLTDEGVLNAISKIIDPEKTKLHGWRTTFMTRCQEMGWPHKLVSRCISHNKPGTAADHAYDRTEFAQLKKKIFQWYADYLDALQAGSPAPPVELPEHLRFA